ncbi:MAG: secondary thiamine-phosphate synthase enzyme YjbQ [Dehalococcoidia bacterium]|nr:secondary thiamine-phosphate synthase enzyme YjbQ [Dehalococcoidia bacterium]MDD5493427.1 secondary thiamine-phosphate synthase enzyme YjbQ [Dehalococcoidia bacterium]
MTVTCKRIQISTNGQGDTINVTSDIAREVNNSGVSNGSVTVFIPGSTAGITTIEFEPGLMMDMKDMWDRVIPSNINYEHNKAWGDGNGHSHIRASLQGASITIPFINKRLTLGTWQQIIIVDFDVRPRSREIILQIMGE